MAINAASDTEEAGVEIGNKHPKHTLLPLTVLIKEVAKEAERVVRNPYSRETHALSISEAIAASATSVNTHTTLLQQPGAEVALGHALAVDAHDQVGAAQEVNDVLILIDQDDLGLIAHGDLDLIVRDDRVRIVREDQEQIGHVDRVLGDHPNDHLGDHSNEGEVDQVHDAQDQDDRTVHEGQVQQILGAGRIGSRPLRCPGV